MCQVQPLSWRYVKTIVAVVEETARDYFSRKSPLSFNLKLMHYVSSRGPFQDLGVILLVAIQGKNIAVLIEAHRRGMAWEEPAQCIATESFKGLSMSDGDSSITHQAGDVTAKEEHFSETGGSRSAKERHSQCCCPCVAVG